MSDNIFKTLGDYVTEVLDKNKDGAISFKEVLGIFPNNAVAIAFVVVDILIAVAEYRVWDVGMKITNGDPYKAAGFVLVSALPFYLAQVLWLYPRADGIQRTIAVLMGASALYTSAQFGLADLSVSYDVNLIVQMVIYLGVGYIIALLVYILVDNGFKANRLKVEAHEKAKQQRERNAITRAVLRDLRESLEEEERLKRDFDPVAVQAQLDRLRGGKGKQNDSSRNNSSIPPFATEKPQDTPKEKRVTSFTLQDYLAKSGMTLEQAQVKFGGKRYSDFAADCNPKFDYINGDNMRAMFAELTGDTNFTQAVTGNHRR